MLFVFLGLPLFLVGFTTGLLILYNSFKSIIPTTGQILLCLLPSLVGLQFLLTALIMDISNEPK